jgi:hypothetical protein
MNKMNWRNSIAIIVLGLSSTFTFAQLTSYGFEFRDLLLDGKES